LYGKLPEQNPFREDGLYDSSWVQLVITEKSEFSMITRKTIIFQFTVSKCYEGWQFRVMDYISYQLGYGRNVILTAEPEHYEEAQQAYQGHESCDLFLRSYEPKFLVHSAPPMALEQILLDGALKSWTRVKAANYISEDSPIGAQLGDPDDFRDYIMLGEGLAPEVVVSSREKGFICMDADCEYSPGARFYFDTSELISKGLLVRDGCHYKVKNELPIHLALFTATVHTLSLEGCKMTPRIFTEAADRAFTAFLQVYQLENSVQGNKPL
jgi:hypothetical protein